VRIYPMEGMAAMAAAHPATAGAVPAVDPIKVAKPLG
jgi:hypothetical protein